MPSLTMNTLSPALLKRFLFHGMGSLVMALLFILPDNLFKWLNPNYKAAFSLGPFLVVWLLSFLLLAIRRRRLFIVFAVFFGTLQLSQFLHFAYFGSLVAPHEVALLFYEWQEIWHTLSGLGGYLSWPLLLIIGAYGAMYWVWWRTGPSRLGIPVPWLWLLTLLAVLPVKAHFVAAKNFYPNPKAYSLQNTLYVFSYFLGRELPSRMTGQATAASSFKTYPPYQLTRASIPHPVNIVVVMGESLSYSHMSLYGYGRETTPLLESLRGDPNFVFKRAISSGVATKVSLPMFFNIMREPDNLGHLTRYETNLFKMAKENGFNTEFISVQTANLTTYAGIEFANHYITQEDILPQFEQRKDDVLVDLLKQRSFAGSNFIVLHQRNSHSPYDKSYPREYEKYPPGRENFHEHMVNTYDNSVRYTDHVLYEVLQTLKAKSKVPTYLFFTSDHGELLGENDKYGHVILEPGVARVPFIFYAINGNPTVIERASHLAEPTHYEIAKLIAFALGYQVSNPSEAPGVFYINGGDLNLAGGYMRVNKPIGKESQWTAWPVNTAGTKAMIRQGANAK